MATISGATAATGTTRFGSTTHQAAAERLDRWIFVFMAALILLWALPLFAYDLLRHGRVPRAYLIWMALFVPLTISVYRLHDSAWWLATAPKLMGIESW